jgi:enoyl-[acyl-carrier protein] reductase I
MMVNNLKNSLNLMEERSPLLRNVTLEDIAGAAIYLASDLSRSVTGSVIKVDAGINIMAPPTVVHPKMKARLKSPPR